MSEIYDSWADDGKEVDPGTLPVRLTELRDNIDPVLPARGEARQRRMDRMQKDLNDIQSFVEDCDRWGEQTRDVRLNRNEVRVLMEGHLAKIRRRAVENGRRLNQELQYVRAQSQ